MIGIGAMLHTLGGGSANDPSKYIGRKIKSAFMDDEANRFNIEFEDGTKIHIWDDGQSCCENRYMRTDDNPSDLVGGTLISIEAKDGPEQSEDYDLHEVVFVEVKTDKGCVTFSNHNEHNGYYGGFGLTITEEA